MSDLKKMTPSEAFVEQLVAEGVSMVPGIVGSAYMDALDLFPTAGIRFLPVAHEQNAAHMADGYARIRNEPTAVIAQNGPGITNFVTAVAAAHAAHTPMVVVTPSAGSMGVGLGGFQEADQLPIFSKITKWQVQVNRPERMAELLRRAFYLARTERGPVQIDIPRDYFYGDYEYDVYTMPRVRPGAGDPEQVQTAARALLNAERPVILAGGGVVQSDAVDDVRALAEFLSAPVACTYLHADAFPYDHALAVGPLGYQGSKAAMKIVSEADVVLAIGTRINPFGTLPQHGMEYWPTSATIIQIDADHRTLGLTKKVQLALLGDAGLIAAQLLQVMREDGGPRPVRPAVMRRVAAEVEAWRRELDSWSGKGGSPLSPRRALSALRDALPENAIVATDVGNVCSVANSYLRSRQPRKLLAAMTFGNCGYSYPTALGAKLAAPGNPVVAYVGDGAWGMSLAEVMTAVREDIPVVAIVFNNAQWGAEKKNQIDFYDDRYVGTDLANPDFAEVARAMGATGYTVDNDTDLKDAFHSALRSGKPAVLNVLIDSTELGEPFRRDALHPPTRHLEKYAHLAAQQ